MQPQSQREQEIANMAWDQGGAAAWEAGSAQNPYSGPHIPAAGTNTRPSIALPSASPGRLTPSQQRRQKEKEAVKWWNDRNEERYNHVLDLTFGFQVWTQHGWLWFDREDQLKLMEAHRRGGGAWEIPDSDYRICMASPTAEQFEDVVAEKGMTADQCVRCQVNTKSETRRAIRLIENIRR